MPEPTAGKLQLVNEPGNKLILHNAGPTECYGLGFNNSNLNAFIPVGGNFSIRNYGFNGTEVFKVNGNGGTLSLLADNLVIDHSWAPSPTIDGTTYESKATISLNGNSSLCLHSPGVGKAALVVDGPIISTEGGANFAGKVNIGNANNGVLSLGNWTLHAEGDALRLIYNNTQIAAFTGSGKDIFYVYKNRDGQPPSFYVNYTQTGGFGVWP